jgi:HEAT repeat protein
MNTELKLLIDRKDWNAIEVARNAGPSVVADVEPYLQSRDAQIRLLAVDCIGAAGGAQSADPLIRALGDSNEQVRIDAVNGLHQHPPKGKEAALLAVSNADRTRDGFVRQQVPLILGRLSARGTIPELRRRLDTEQRAEVKDGLVTGLAKLGDAPARAEFAELLRDARGERTAELMEYVRYIDEPWVIPQLVPVLERREIAVDLSTHRKSLLRRECDLAVDAVLRISKATFGFTLDELTQYEDAQIAEALRYARAQPR